MTIAVLAKDNAEPATGLEYGNKIGDAGFILKLGDGAVTNAAWKAKAFFRGPLNSTVTNPTVEGESRTAIHIEKLERDLGDHVALVRRLPPEQRRQFVRSMFEALAHIHSLRVAHMDLKPVRARAAVRARIAGSCAGHAGSGSR